MSAGAGSVKAGEAYVAIGVDLGPLKAGLAKMQAAVAGAGSQLQGIGVKMGLAAAAMAAPLYKSLDAFAEQEQAEVRLSAILKATGRDAETSSKQIVDLAGAMQQTTLFSDDAVISAGAVLAKFQELDGAQFPNLIQQSADLAATIGSDLPSAASLLGRALAQPEMGVALLNRQLKLFDKEEQKALQAMAASGQESRVRAIMLDKLAKSTKGVAEALGKTFTGQIQIAVGLLGEVAEAVGSVLAPALQFVTAFIKENVQTVIDWVKENQSLVVAFAAVAAALAVLGPLAVVLGTAFAGVASAMAVVGAVVGAIVSPIGLIVAAIAAAAVALVDWGALWKSVMGGAFDGITSFSGAMEVMWAQMKVLWAKGVAWIEGSWDGIETSIAGVVLSAEKTWAEFTGFLVSGISGALSTISDLWDSAVSWIAEQVVKIGAYVEGTDPTQAIESLRQDRADAQAKAKAAEQADAKRRQAELASFDDAQTQLTADAKSRADERAQAVLAAEQGLQDVRNKIMRKELVDMVKSSSTEAEVAAKSISSAPTATGAGVPFGTPALALAGSIGTFSGELAGRTGFTKTEAIDKKQLDSMKAIERYTRDTAEGIDDVGGLV